MKPSNKTQAHKDRDQLLISLGFTFEHDKWFHKMMPDTGFDFSATDPDIFWTMDTIFKSCVKVGENKKAAEIRNVMQIH